VLLIYSFELKSAFGAGSQLLMLVSFLAVRCVFWLKDSTVKVSEKGNRKSPPKNTTVQLFQLERHTTKRYGKTHRR